jgi:hypothetical protein
MQDLVPYRLARVRTRAGLTDVLAAGAEDAPVRAEADEPGASDLESESRLIC